MLNLEYVFDGSLLSPEKYEASPTLLWWTSANQGWYKMVPVFFNGSNKKSTLHMVSIPIDDSANLEADDSIRVELLVKTENAEGTRSFSKAGTASISLEDVMEEINKRGFFKRAMPIEMRNVVLNSGEFVIKGGIEIWIRNNVNWTFKAPGPYSLVSKNQGFIDTVLRTYSERTVKPFTSGDFPPSDERLKIHVPLVMNEVYPYPIIGYWLDKNPEIKAEERFMVNVLEICLGRRNMSMDEFTSTTKKQLSSKTKDILPAFLKCLIIVASVCTAFSNAMPYMSDLMFSCSKNNKKPKKVIIESFHDASFMHTGDCEDLGCLIHRSAREFKYNKWEHEGLKCVQSILNYYVTFGCLGSVTSAYLGEDDENKESSRLPIIIGSRQDKEAKVGYHIYAESDPLVHVESKIEFTSKSSTVDLHKDIERMPWESELPVMILEGTGYLFHLLKPYKDYFKDEKDQQMAKDYVRKQISMIKVLFSLNDAFKVGSFERPQVMLDDVKDSRLSTFYREATHVYTDDLVHKGYNFMEFTWMKETNGNWEWGVSTRDRVYKNKKTGLIVTPGYTEHEMGVVKSILRQLPPKGLFAYSEPDNVNILRDAVDKSQKEYDSILRGRTQGSDTGSVNIFFRQQYFLSEKFQKKIKEEISSVTEIFKITVFLEIFTKDVVIFRLEVSMNNPRKERLEEIDREVKRQKREKQEREEEEEGDDDDELERKLSPFESICNITENLHPVESPFVNISWYGVSQEDVDTELCEFENDIEKNIFVELMKSNGNSSVPNGYEHIKSKALDMLHGRNAQPVIEYETNEQRESRISKLKDSYSDYYHTAIKWSSNTERIIAVYTFSDARNAKKFAKTVAGRSDIKLDKESLDILEKYKSKGMKGEVLYVYTK